MSDYTNNLHRVFVDQKIGFKKKITPTEQDLNFFNQVKKDVKSHLKTKISHSRIVGVWHLQFAGQTGSRNGF